MVNKSHIKYTSPCMQILQKKVEMMRTIILNPILIRRQILSQIHKIFENIEREKNQQNFEREKKIKAANIKKYRMKRTILAFCT